MKRYLEYAWPVFGLCAVVISLVVLAREFEGQHVASEVWHQLGSLSAKHYLLSALAALVAYAALAWYDLIALRHLGIRWIPWPFVTLCSFCTYALSHTIGVSVLSGAMIRYRAYSTKGLSAAQVGLLVAFCSLTFLLGVLLVGGIVLLLEPRELRRIAEFLPHFMTNTLISQVVGGICLAVVATYVAASILRLQPINVWGFQLAYPEFDITARQLSASVLELIGAGGIIYFALPHDGNPGFFVVLAIFLGSFSAALASNAPAGAGVFDLLFINALPTIPKAKVLAAVLLFRLFYLVIPLLIAIVVIAIFERQRLRRTKATSTLPQQSTAAPRTAR